MLGSLLLLMALVYRLVQRLPITTTIVYLLIGVALGPLWRDVIRIDPILDAPWLHRAAEVSVVVSLFTVGLKLRLPLFDRRLRAALWLAFVSMVITVGLVTAAGVWLLGLPLGAAVLLGAILAPTDPVLASDVQTKDPQDQDKLRITLSAEGGLNDGTAFPLVMLGLGLLGLHELGDYAWRWWTIDVLWAVVGGLAIGGSIGAAVGWLVKRLNSQRRVLVSVGEYLVLGLIGVSYGAAVLLHAYGFLAVFAAGVALRLMDRKGAPAQPEASQPVLTTHTLIATNSQLERILEVALVLIVGAVLLVAGLSVEAFWFAPLLFLVIRPVAALPLLFVSGFSRFEYGMVSWFGIRGIGSLYYLMFAIEKGLPPDIAAALASLTLTTIALSILVHGVSVTPALKRYARLVGRDAPRGPTSLEPGPTRRSRGPRIAG